MSVDSPAESPPFLISSFPNTILSSCSIAGQYNPSQCRPALKKILGKNRDILADVAKEPCLFDC